MLKILLVPVTYIGDLYKAFTYPKTKNTSTQGKPVLKYYDHIIWGFSTLGVSLASIFTGMQLFNDWYGNGDYTTTLYALVFTGLASFVVTFISLIFYFNSDHKTK